MNRVAAAVAATMVACSAACSAVPSATGPAPAPAAAPVPTVVAAPATTPDLRARLDQASAVGAGRGAQVSIGFLDRATGTYMGTADTIPVATASVVKLFIADDLLFRDARGDITLNNSDRNLIVPMLESSDDTAAEELWNQYGEDDIVARVAQRYRLVATGPPPDGRWFNTVTTAADLVRYYSFLLDGSGGLPRDRADLILGYLESFTPEGTDGYPQSFGIPTALPAETLRGVKQGWMCCVSGRWVHLSTGFVGDGARYVLAVVAQERPYTGAGGSASAPAISVSDDDSAKHARATLTAALSALFPAGSVPG